MKRVDPIRSIKKVNDMKKYLLGSGNIRNYSMVVLGLNTALRISDILKLTWGEVYDFNREEFKTHVAIIEKKTKKSKVFKLNNSAIEVLTMLFDSIEDPKVYEYIFRSREGGNKPLTRQMASNIIKTTADSVGIKGIINCHSLRKTFGYHSWKKGVPIQLLMELYNHSSEKETKKYLGINQDDLDKVYTTVEL